MTGSSAGDSIERSGDGNQDDNNFRPDDPRPPGPNASHEQVTEYKNALSDYTREMLDALNECGV